MTTTTLTAALIPVLQITISRPFWSGAQEVKKCRSSSWHHRRCHISSIDNRRQFIILIVHLCVHHDRRNSWRREGRDTARRAGSSAAEDYISVTCAGVLGLDNLDYTASVLDMARSRQSRLNAAAAAGGTSTHHDDEAVLGASTDGSQLAGRPRTSSLLGVSSLRRQGGGVSAAMTRLSGRRRGGQPAFRRLSVSMSPQKLRKIMDIMNAGRRR